MGGLLLLLWLVNTCAGFESDTGSKSEFSPTVSSAPFFTSPGTWDPKTTEPTSESYLSVQDANPVKHFSALHAIPESSDESEEVNHKVPSWKSAELSCPTLSNVTEEDYNEPSEDLEEEMPAEIWQDANQGNFNSSGTLVDLDKNVVITQKPDTRKYAESGYVSLDSLKEQLNVTTTPSTLSTTFTKTSTMTQRSTTATISTKPATSTKFFKTTRIVVTTRRPAKTTSRAETATSTIAGSTTEEDAFMANATSDVYSTSESNSTSESITSDEQNKVSMSIKRFQPDPEGELEAKNRTEEEREVTMKGVSLDPVTLMPMKVKDETELVTKGESEEAESETKVRVKRQHWSSADAAVGIYAEETANFRKEFAKHRFSPNLVRNMSPIFMRRFPKSLSNALNGQNNNHPRDSAQRGSQENPPTDQHLSQESGPPQDQGHPLDQSQEKAHPQDHQPHHSQEKSNPQDTPQAQETAHQPPEQNQSQEMDQQQPPDQSQERDQQQQEPPADQSQEKDQDPQPDPAPGNTNNSNKSNIPFHKLPRGRKGDPQKLWETQQLREEQRRVHKKLKIRKLPLVTKVPVGKFLPRRPHLKQQQEPILDQ